MVRSKKIEILFPKNFKIHANFGNTFQFGKTVFGKSSFGDDRSFVQL